LDIHSIVRSFVLFTGDSFLKIVSVSKTFSPICFLVKKIPL